MIKWSLETQQMAKSNDKLSLLSFTDSVPCKHVHYIKKSLLVLSASTDEGESVWIRFAHSHRVILVMAFWNRCFTFHAVQTNRCDPRESTSRSPDSRKYSKKVHWKNGTSGRMCPIMNLWDLVMYVDVICPRHMKNDIGAIAGQMKTVRG